MSGGGVQAVLAGGLAAFAIALAGAWVALGAPAILAEVEARSSHVRPTPRTGGLAVMGAVLAVTLAAAIARPDWRSDLGALAAVSAVMAAFGLADDVMRAPPWGKFAAQAGAALSAAYGIASFETLPVPFAGDVALGPAGPLLTAFWIVAFMNAFNFMDGLNGMAAAAAAVGGAACAAAASAAGAETAALVYGVAALAALGFAPFNILGGRIFLGDNGSQPLAFLLAAAAPLAARDGPGFGTAFAPIVFAPFLFDVLYTLVRRARRGARLSEAHKEHLYQRLHQKGWPHAGVSLLYAGMIAACAGAAFASPGLGAAAVWGLVAGLAAAFAAAMAALKPAPPPGVSENPVSP